MFPKIVGKPPNHPFVHRVWNHYFHHPFWGENTPIFGNIHVSFRKGFTGISPAEPNGKITACRFCKRHALHPSMGDATVDG